MADPVLRCSDLTVGYDHPILSGVELEVSAGEIVALIGPNGSGKSTLLHTLSGTLPKLSGSIRLGEVDADSISIRERARQVCFVPQEELQVFDYSALEVAIMGRFSHRSPLNNDETDREIALESLRQIGALDLQDRPMTKLSGGEKQRVLIARALAQGSPLMLLDEPSSHLDLHFQLELIELLQQLAQKQNKAVIAAIHDVRLAFQLTERIVLVHNAKIQFDGSPQELAAGNWISDVYGVRLSITERADGELTVPNLRNYLRRTTDRESGFLADATQPES